MQRKGGIFGFGILGKQDSKPYGSENLRKVTIRITRKMANRDEIIRILDEVANQVAVVPKTTLFDLQLEVVETF